MLGESTSAKRRAGGCDVSATEYEVIISGHLGPALTRSFEGLEVGSCGPHETYLRGWFVDQAALQGLLTTLGNLGIELSEVRRLSDAVPAHD